VPGDLASLSPRAQEILRRADEQVASLRRVRALATAEADGTAEAAEPLDASDPQRLMDRVQSGLEASAEHLETLHRAIEAIAAELGVEPVPVGAGAPTAPVVPPLLAVHATMPDAALAVAHHDEELAEAQEAPPTHAVSGAAQDAGRLVAIEMAVAGDTRENVGRRLREEFGIPEPQQILDDVFGPGTAAGSRMPWGGR
jgi:hypothetical protein